MAERICKVPDCGRRHWARGYCGSCYSRVVAHGGPEIRPPKPSKPGPSCRIWARDCIVCGKAFFAKCPNGKSCSLNCHKIRDRSQTREQRAANKDARNLAARTARQSLSPAERERRLALERVAARARYARTGLTPSAREALQRRRANKRGAVVERFKNADVFERDRWRCGLCKRRVNRYLAWPHPKSPSLDHIVPLSLGGNHTKANVRLTHLDCNISRKNRGDAEQLALC